MTRRRREHREGPDQTRQEAVGLAGGARFDASARYLAAWPGDALRIEGPDGPQTDWAERPTSGPATASRAAGAAGRCPPPPPRRGAPGRAGASRIHTNRANILPRCFLDNNENLEFDHVSRTVLRPGAKTVSKMESLRAELS